MRSIIALSLVASLLLMERDAGAAPVRAAPSSQGASAPALSALISEAEALLAAHPRATGEVSGRLKSPQSLHAKAARKGLRPDQVLDRVGLRLIVSSESDCYALRRALLDRYDVVEGSEDDYIAHPKANGYRSLHLAVRTPYGVAEYQLRTREMHEHAEHGAAAHWRYKHSTAAA